MPVKVGDVFIWKDYPYQADQQVKRRWFVCLGEVKEDPLETDSRLVQIIAPTTTTQTGHYLSDGHREGHPVVLFSRASGYGFTTDCLLDLGMEPAVWQRAEVESKHREGKILVKGTLPDKVLRDIYFKVCASRSYAPKLKRQIKANLNAAGITGLLNPPERHRPTRR